MARLAANREAVRRARVLRDRDTDGPDWSGQQGADWRPLLQDLATVQRNICQAQGQKGSPQAEFELDTQLSAEQKRAVELLQGIKPC